MRPYLFRLPDWSPIAPDRPIFSYGILLGLSFIVGWSLCVHTSRRDGFDARVASGAMFVIVLTSMLGSRCLHVLSSGSDLRRFFSFDQGGLVAWGGIIGALGGSYLYLRWKRCDFWAYADNAAAPLAVGLGITRLGCFLFGCDYGLRTASAAAVRFPTWDAPDVGEWIPRAAPAYTAHANAADPPAVFSDAVHPTQLYESIVGFVAFGVLLLWLDRKRFHGQLMLAFLAYYGALRFLLELCRGDADRNEDFAGLGMSTSQVIGIAVVVAAVPLWLHRRRLGLYAAAGTLRWASGKGD